MSEITPIMPSTLLAKVVKIEPDQKSRKQPPKQAQQKKIDDQAENNDQSGHIDEIV